MTRSILHAPSGWPCWQRPQACRLPPPRRPAATTYTITDLGSLGLGTSDSLAGNATGQVIGYSYLSTLVPTCPPVYGNTKKTCVEHPWHAFFHSNGQMTDLGTVAAGTSAGAARSTGQDG